MAVLNDGRQDRERLATSQVLEAEPAYQERPWWSGRWYKPPSNRWQRLPLEATRNTSDRGTGYQPPAASSSMERSSFLTRQQEQ